jgi:hypothetical protein
VFRHQIKSAINEGRFMLYEMQVDKQPFPVNTMELQHPMVLVRVHQAEATKHKNVMVGEAKPVLRGKELTREVTYEKTPDGRGSDCTGRSDHPYTWPPKDVCSEAARDWNWKLNMPKN